MHRYFSVRFEVIPATLLVVTNLTSGAHHPFQFDAQVEVSAINPEVVQLLKIDAPSLGTFSVMSDKNGLTISAQGKGSMPQGMQIAND